MKLITLCANGSCCPVVKVYDDKVEIGEEGNLCTLTPDQWETLKSKIQSSETWFQSSTSEGAQCAPSLFRPK